MNDLMAYFKSLAAKQPGSATSMTATATWKFPRQHYLNDGTSIRSWLLDDRSQADRPVVPGSASLSSSVIGGIAATVGPHRPD